MSSASERDLETTIQFYDQHADSYEWGLGKNAEVQKSFISPLQPELNSDSLLIDLCCGKGSFLNGLNAAGIVRYIGVDASEAMLAEARQRFPDNDFRLGRAESLASVVPETCDAFSVIHGFTHISPSAAHKFIKGLRAVLRTNAVGVVIIGATSGTPKSTVMRRQWRDVSNVVGVSWSVKELRKCFEQSRFKRINTTTEYQDPDNMALYFRAI